MYLNFDTPSVVESLLVILVDDLAEVVEVVEGSVAGQREGHITIRNDIVGTQWYDGVWGDATVDVLPVFVSQSGLRHGHGI